jgi:hypothetical protein
MSRLERLPRNLRIKNTELVAALAQHELAFPAGHCPTVAIGGYLLAGGQG